MRHLAIASLILFVLALTSGCTRVYDGSEQFYENSPHQFDTVPKYYHPLDDDSGNN